MRRSPCRSDEVDVQLDVLGPFVVHRVCQHVYGRDLVIVGDDGLGDAAIEFTKKLTKPAAAALATARYLASTLERGTVGCGLEDQETSASPRNMQKLDVERLVSGNPA